jgi:hypothetical protein
MFRRRLSLAQFEFSPNNIEHVRRYSGLKAMISGQSREQLFFEIFNRRSEKNGCARHTLWHCISSLVRNHSVKYLLLGGGGAQQDPILSGRTSIKVPAKYPPDLCWKGQPPKEEYNYVLVDVEPGHSTKFTPNRLRPWSAKPFENVEL